MSFLYGKILAQNPEPPWLQCALQAFNDVPCLDKLLDSSLRSTNFIQENVLGKRTLRCTSKDSNQRISSNRGLFSVNLSCHRHLTSSSNPLDGIVSLLDVSSCTHTTIAGYWVGPDIDDGWGYVEAFVNQIT